MKLAINISSYSIHEKVLFFLFYAARNIYIINFKILDIFIYNKLQGHKLNINQYIHCTILISICFNRKNKIDQKQFTSVLRFIKYVLSMNLKEMNLYYVQHNTSMKC